MWWDRRCSTFVNKNTIAPFINRSPEAPRRHNLPLCWRDRWCAIAVFTEEEWQAFCTIVENPVLTNDSRFATLDDRLAHHDVLDRCVEEWTRQHSPEEVMALLQQAGVPAGVVANGEDLDRDPQLRARGYWATVQTPEGDAVILDGTPIKLSATPGSWRLRPLGRAHEGLATAAQVF